LTNKKVSVSIWRENSQLVEITSWRQPKSKQAAGHCITHYFYQKGIKNETDFEQMGFVFSWAVDFLGC
jgi:hypothetical protein